MELVRQPVFLLISTTVAVLAVFLASVPYFGFGDEPKLVKHSVLALILLAGLVCAVLSASSSVTREIRTGTALAVLAKPVGRAQFLLAKYIGLAAALVVLVYVGMLAALLASRMAYDAYGSTDWVGLGIFSGFIVLAYVVGAFSNFFLHRPFVSEAVFSLTAATTVAFVLINFLSKEGRLQPWGTGIDWRMVPAGVLLLFAVWVLAALALACSTRLEVMASLAVCSAFFLLGLMSDYLFGRRAEAGQWWASVLYTVLPNWQLLWMADALDRGRSIPWSYVGTAVVYVLGYAGAALAVALALFEDRELT